MAKMSNDELVALVYREISKADGYEGRAMQENFRNALKYYFRRPRGDEQTGKSKIISGDVADMVHAILAHMDIALASDCYVEFEPQDEADEERARVESAFCHDLIFNKANGFIEIREAVVDLLLVRNGILKVWISESEEVTREDYDEISDEELAARVLIIEESDREWELTSREGNAAALKVTRTRRKFNVEAVPREMFLTENNLNSIFLDKARFHAERRLCTRSELIEEGVPKAQARRLNALTSETWADATARNRGDENYELAAEEPSMDKIETFNCIMKVDIDGDGKAELWRVWVGDRQLLKKEKIDFSCYVAGTGWLEPHRFHGLSCYDLLWDIQDQKTGFLRQWMDNARDHNEKRLTVVENQVDMGDVLEGAAVIRQMAPGAVGELATSDIGPSCEAGLNYLDKVRSERAGAALDMVSSEMQLVGSGGVNGMERQISSRELMSALITRTVAETLIRSLFMLVHATARSQLTGKHNFRTAGRWESTEPTTWPARDECKVKFGMSAGERMKRSAALGQNVQMQLQLGQAGYAGRMVTDETLYRSVIDWARASEVDVPENYYIDPKSEEGQQNAQNAAQAARGQQAQQERLLQIQTQLEGTKIQVDREKIRADVLAKARELALEYFKTRMDAEIEEAKIVGQATLDLNRAQMQAEQRESVNGGAGGNGTAGAGGA